MRAELVRLLHQTLTSMGIKDGDVHMIIEWIEDEDDANRIASEAALQAEQQKWMLRTAGLGAIGLTLGAAVTWIACAWIG